MSDDRSDWSPLLAGAAAHFDEESDTSLTFDEWAAFGWMAHEVTPLVTIAHEHDAPDAVEAAVDLVLLSSLPESMRALAPSLRAALLIGGLSLWRHLTAVRLIEADEIRVVSVP